MNSDKDIIDQIGFFDDWEQRYSFIIDLGKQLKPFDEKERTEANLVRGCQSQVWLKATHNNNTFHFEADSDASIVQGLLAIVLTAYQDKTAREILDYDVEDYLSQLDLLNHISVTRGNGLRAMILRIQILAKSVV